MIICFIPIFFVSVIYAQEFEVNEEDYFSSEEEKQEDAKTNTNSKDFSTAATDSEDTDKEPCIDGQIESSAAVLSALSDDSYTSNFHFVKKFDQNGNLVDSWGTV